MTESRADAIGRLRDLVSGIDVSHTVRVAIDGITGSGKTTLANELAEQLTARDRPVVRVSMDGFHQPRAMRYRQGRGSADGYYEDAYDLTAFADLVLRPLGPGGAGRYTAAIIDLATDTPLELGSVEAPPDACLIVDGSFLQRDELAGLWDLVVWIDTSFAEARRRGAARDADFLGGLAAAEAAFDNRYHAAARRYLTEVDPIARADVIFGNDETARPVVRLSRSSEIG